MILFHKLSIFGNYKTLHYQRWLTVRLTYDDFGSDSSAISHRFYLGRKVEFHAIVIVNSGAKKACHYMHSVAKKDYKVVFEFYYKTRLIKCLGLNLGRQNGFVLRKVVIGCMTCSGRNQARNPRAQILPFWSKTDMDSVKKNFYLAPDLKMVRPKEVANDQKINLAP